MGDTLRQNEGERLADYGARVGALGFKLCAAPKCAALVPSSESESGRIFSLCAECSVRLRKETGLVSREKVS